MALSVYVHIPYCLQRCKYCDFTTFEWSEILPPKQYVALVCEEIRSRHSFWPQSEIQTLYFGGGTPSLIDPELIVAICDELANVGFSFLPNCETTIEINPATLDEKKLDIYLKSGFNRFSVGAQSFDDKLLQICGRKHSSADTRATLRLLQRHNLNYTFDLLFALPGQSMESLKLDLKEVLEWAPPHLSAYCLTVPEGHSMNKGRPPEMVQVEMFREIEDSLLKIDLRKYEVSNFAKPGFESRHNMTYWTDENYWGIGLSSHSYGRNFGPFGMRFWNPKSLEEYGRQVSLKGLSFPEVLPTDQYESLKLHEALTDFCHVTLRTARGLSEEALRNRFPEKMASQVNRRLESLVRRKLLECASGRWSLTREGHLISNKVFEELTFLANDIAEDGLTRAFGDSYCSV